MKLMKLSEQKELAEQMRNMVDELSDSNLRVRKNLEVAISISKRPGNIHYYQPEPKIRDAEESKILEKMLSSIKKIEIEIEQINKELGTCKYAEHGHTVGGASSTLKEWFGVYGRPSIGHEDKLTSFVESSKIYGGTSHHRAFKSQSLVMKKSRLTA